MQQIHVRVVKDKNIHLRPHETTVSVRRTPFSPPDAWGRELQWGLGQTGGAMADLAAVQRSGRNSLNRSWDRVGRRVSTSRR